MPNPFTSNSTLIAEFKDDQEISKITGIQFVNKPPETPSISIAKGPSF